MDVGLQTVRFVSVHFVRLRGLTPVSEWFEFVETIPDLVH
jgi:hypothetical protein